MDASVSRFVSRYVFGSTLPVGESVIDLALERWCRLHASGIVRSLAADFHQKCYLRLPASLIPPDVIAEARTEFERVMDDSNCREFSYPIGTTIDDRGTPSDPPSAILVPEAGKHMRSVPRLLAVLTPFARSCFRSSFRVRSATALRLHPIQHDLHPSRRALLNSWHLDEGSRWRLRIIVALTPFGPGLGATELVDAPTTARLIRGGMLLGDSSRGQGESRVESHLATAGIQVERHNGPPGSTLLFNPGRCLHRAGPRSAGIARDSIGFDLRGSRVMDLAVGGLSEEPVTR